MASRARRQKIVRNTHVKLVLQKIAKRLNTEQDMKRMRPTNRLLPVGSLRRRSVKRIFQGWTKSLTGKGRILTQKLCSQVVKALRSQFELSPLDDEMTEVLRLQYLLKQARKRHNPGQKKTTAMSYVDSMDTLLMAEPSVEDWCLFCYPRILLLQKLNLQTIAYSVRNLWINPSRCPHWIQPPPFHHTKNKMLLQEVIPEQDHHDSPQDTQLDTGSPLKAESPEPRLQIKPLSIVWA